MGKHIAHTINNIIINNNKKAKDCNALILGVTFKENCSDLRNSKVFKLYKSLIRLGIKVDIFDPHAINEDVFKVYNLKLINQIKKKYDVIILAVAHDIFLKMNLIKFKKSKGIIYDVKSVLDRKIITKRL
jgi:UDP-N-acetyl-D-galactosamine dehydrogenase